MFPVWWSNWAALYSELNLTFALQLASLCFSQRVGSSLCLVLNSLWINFHWQHDSCNLLQLRSGLPDAQEWKDQIDPEWRSQVHIYISCRILSLRFCKAPLAKDSPWKGLFCIEAYSQGSNSHRIFGFACILLGEAVQGEWVASVAVPKMGFAMMF